MMPNNQPIKIRLSDPVAGDNPLPHWQWYQQIVAKICRPGTTLDTVCLKKGYSNLTPYTTAYNTVSMVQRGYESERNGYDAFIIGCATDLGVSECRAVLNIPVIGAAEAAILLASTFGNKFSIITANSKICVMLRNLVRNYGFLDRLASVRVVPNLTTNLVFEMMYTGKQKEVIDLMTAQMAKAVNEDGAEALVVACMPTSSMLTNHGVHTVEGAPIIDLFSAAVKSAETQVHLKRAYGLGVCKRSIYLAPNPGWEKEIPIDV